MEELIQSPEGATYYAEESLRDYHDPSASLAVSVHEINSISYCNTWIKKNGTWSKFLPERTLNQRAGPLMLVGEINRAELLRKKDIYETIQLAQGFYGLHETALKVAYPGD